MLNIIIEETNRAAKQFYEPNRDQIEDGEVPFTWNCLEMDELNTFLGLLLLMGIIYLPALHLYWSKDELYHCPIFGECMTRDRWKTILRF